MFIEKIRFITNLILNIKIKFFYPKKNRILIFDKELSRINCKILNLKDYGVLHTRKEEICLPIIIKLLISFKLNSLNYYIEYIKHSGAKVIITFIDNNFLFYKLKKNLNSKTFISIQNGHRMAYGDIFGFLKFKNVGNLSADAIFTFNKHIAKEYKKKISSKFFYTGSIKNNYLKKKKFKINKRNLTFISAYRPIMSEIINDNMSFNDYEERYKKKYKLKHRQGINFDMPKILNKYCHEKKLKFVILGATNNDKEKYFYDKLIGEQNYKFIRKKNTFSNYTEIDKSNLLVSTYSTLGYEAFSRGKKICFFSPSLSSFEKSYSFGWPYIKTKKAFFYSNEINYKSICKILNKVKNMGDGDWLKKTSTIQKNVMIYQKNNKLMKKYINCKLIKKS